MLLKKKPVAKQLVKDKKVDKQTAQKMTPEHNLEAKKATCTKNKHAQVTATQTPKKTGSKCNKKVKSQPKKAKTKNTRSKVVAPTA